jgi:hypothetical protein
VTFAVSSGCSKSRNLRLLLTMSSGSYPQMCLLEELTSTGVPNRSAVQMIAGNYSKTALHCVSLPYLQEGIAAELRPLQRRIPNATAANAISAGTPSARG